MASILRLAAVLPTVTCAAALCLCLPARAQDKPDPGPMVFPNTGTSPGVRVDGPEALTCASLFNWIERHRSDLAPDQSQRLDAMIDAITVPGLYTVPAPDACVATVQSMAREGFDIGDLAPRRTLGVQPECEDLVPFVQSRIGLLDSGQQLALRRVMARVHMPQRGETHDMMACFIVHGALERLNLIDQMR
ncbi:hypothetical protein [Pararhodobacter zhoushanensis]|uniref:hypothetical protein n=1 Tax=Pararhodobacter zhoushanensis TaxID=2479545 RepID=UPI000F8F2261|nr:hypothetical protein [Pararhodobacter zhoushanensis]